MLEMEAEIVLRLPVLVDVVLLVTVVLVDISVLLLEVVIELLEVAIELLEEESALSRITANSAALLHGPRFPASVLAVIRT